MSADLGVVSGRDNWGNIVKAIEHIMELEFPRDIMGALATVIFRLTTTSNGPLVNIPLPSGPVDSGFIDYVLNQVSNQSPDMTGMTRRTNTNVNVRRLYWTLGNYPNDQHFVIVSESLNTLKSQV